MFKHTALGPRELPVKQSWAVVEQRELPLSVRREEQGGVAVVVTEALSLEVTLARGTWRLLDAAGRELARCEDVSGEVMPDYPVDRFRWTACPSISTTWRATRSGRGTGRATRTPRAWRARRPRRV
ncbi:MAG TPA: hypothetical protein VFZ09_23365 [Archangium sp.]|uniref:hypothetical protein n=1 Tax=Archangium sp. TaxID=1872627 RepID=UPI002E327FA4|nr:hypothetical protein [Archangium sp.]HEX5749190.1 hypothetical protein [Archangium sp.]